MRHMRLLGETHGSFVRIPTNVAKSVDLSFSAVSKSYICGTAEDVDRQMRDEACSPSLVHQYGRLQSRGTCKTSRVHGLGSFLLTNSS